MSNSAIIEELVKMRNARVQLLCDNDPQWNRLQGMIDFAEGRVGLKDDNAKGNKEEAAQEAA